VSALKHPKEDCIIHLKTICMRKYLFFVVLGMIVSGTASAQLKPKFKHFTFDIGAGQVISGASGPIVYFEPGYTFFNKVKFGVRLEVADVPMKMVVSSVFALDYYQLIPGTGIRLFAGGGLGSYSVSAQGGCGGGPGTTSTSRETGSFGGMVRAGIKAGHFSLGIDYNFVPTTHVYDKDVSAKIIGIKDHENTYYGVRLGLSIGGGKKKIKL
jgi:hypothetical protein